MSHGNRFDVNLFEGKNIDTYWADLIADEVINKFPNKEVYTCAAGISPSGVVHFGNLRDVMTVYAVSQSLQRKGKKTRIIFSWDNLDRFRKVPAGLPENMAEHIGKALTSVPDHEGVYSSYAEKNQKDFEESMMEIQIPLEYKNQTENYKNGLYTEGLDKAIKNRKQIAKILFSFMTDIGKTEKGITEENFIETFYPVSVYSSFTQKDATEILGYDNFILKYRCKITDQIEEIDIRKTGQVKLSWKIDWAMRWAYEDVVFEPGGHDHASPGGSYDTSSVIARVIYDIEPPVFVGYQFIGIQGIEGKMSSSKGNALSPRDLLSIYEPELLKWLYLRKNPHQAFQLVFNSEIIRQYDEFDNDIVLYKEGKLPQDKKYALEDSFSLNESESLIKNYEPMSFRQISSFGQIVNWDLEKMILVAEKNGTKINKMVLKKRMEKAFFWLDTYNKEEMISVLQEKNSSYLQGLDSLDLEHIERLSSYLKDLKEISIEELEKEIYAIPRIEDLDKKENAVRQRNFFKHVYMLLIGKETGPRLSTFIWALGKDKVISLIS